MDWTVAGRGVSVELALWLALVSAVVLTVLHLAAPRIRRLRRVPERAAGSFAGGTAVAYVFLHLLPELAEGNTRLRDILGERSAPTPIVELGIFVVALLGFALFYVLEHAARTTGEHAPGRDAGRRRVFRLHLASYLLYNAVITYTLPLTYRTGVAFAVLFTVAMGLHFVLTDRGLHAHYGEWFDRTRPRLLLGASLMAGWGLAVLFAPTSAVTVSVLVAFLAGSVLLNVFKEELPSTRQSSVGWFAAGLATYGLLLAMVTALGTSEGDAGHGADAGPAERTGGAPPGQHVSTGV